MENVKIELIGYSEDFIKSCNTGWGCGYVLIPLEHPFLVQKLLNEDEYNFYPSVKGFSEEITLSEKEGDFLRIGFDTAHSWNNSSHDLNFVQDKAIELKNCIDSYTMLDAKKEVESYFNKLRVKFEKYL